MSKSVPKSSVDFITGKEMSKILQICGYKESDYARFIGRSASYVNRVLGYERKHLPLVESEKLRMMVGEENYQESKRELSGQERKKWLTGRELQDVMYMCGKTLVSFSQYLGKGKGFVSESLVYNRYGIGLQYIDALTSFVGKEVYIAALEEVRRQHRLQHERRQSSLASNQSTSGYRP